MVDGEKPGVDSRDEGKHTGRNDLLFVEKMMPLAVFAGPTVVTSVHRPRRSVCSNRPHSHAIQRDNVAET